LASLSSRKRPGLHITCIGADAPGKTELTPEFVAKADLLVADTIGQTIERGEFRGAIQSGLIQTEFIQSLGKVVQELDFHRKSADDNRLTIFDSSGVALQDCVISSITYQALKKL
jgi:ornithine cyclodeaminase